MLVKQGSLSCGIWDLYCVIQDLSLRCTGSVVVAHTGKWLSCPSACGILVPWTKNQTCIPCTERWIFNHWTKGSPRFWALSCFNANRCLGLTMYFPCFRTESAYWSFGFFNRKYYLEIKICVLVENHVTVVNREKYFRCCNLAAAYPLCPIASLAHCYSVAKLCPIFGTLWAAACHALCPSLSPGVCWNLRHVYPS